jgi:plasmid maintenance system antidote protein VapI
MLGRPRALTPEQVEMARTMMANPKLSARQVAEQLGVHRATAHHLCAWAAGMRNASPTEIASATDAAPNSIMACANTREHDPRRQDRVLERLAGETGLAGAPFTPNNLL